MLNKLKNQGIIAVVRADSHETALSYIDACIKGGIIAIELTYTIPDALTLIKKVAGSYNNILLGVGSVLTAKMAQDAIAAGATFIVSPGFDDGVNTVCHENNIPYVPGCMTITEMMNVMSKGNKMVKLFPGEVFGPGYIKSVKAPIPHIEIMPTGGVSIDNIEEWFKNGVSCVGIGSSLFKSNDPKTIESLAREFVNKIEKIRG